MAIKPTKVTKDDLELADEISRVTTIKSILDGFTEAMTVHFDDLRAIAETSNPVQTYLAIVDKQDVLVTAAQYVQAQLLEILGQVDGDVAHELAAPQEPEVELAGPEGQKFNERPDVKGEIDPEIAAVFNEEEKE